MQGRRGVRLKNLLHPIVKKDLYPQSKMLFSSALLGKNATFSKENNCNPIKNTFLMFVLFVEYVWNKKIIPSFKKQKSTYGRQSLPKGPFTCSLTQSIKAIKKRKSRERELQQQRQRVPSLRPRIPSYLQHYYSPFFFACCNSFRSKRLRPGRPSCRPATQRVARWHR